MTRTSDDILKDIYAAQEKEAPKATREKLKDELDAALNAERAAELANAPNLPGRVDGTANAEPLH